MPTEILALAFIASFLLELLPSICNSCAINSFADANDGWLDP